VKHILSAAHRSLIHQFARSRVLLAFDFDGTLAPIVTDPADAEMRPSTRTLLGAVASAYRCAVISGRSRDDVRRRLRGVRLVDVVGNHGAEASSRSAQVARAMKRTRGLIATWSRLLAVQLADAEGIEIENKGLSIAVHYRKSRDRRGSRRRIDAAVTKLGQGARAVSGKLAVNITPEEAPHKGMALRRLREKYGADTAVYVGDDRTDEDVFAEGESDRLLSIRVGPSRTSHATYYLKNQAEIDDLLHLLIADATPRRTLRTEFNAGARLR
jgi:trehalose 6-phosphate phosphatase